LCLSSESSSCVGVLNDGREGVGSNSVALHFCFNPPRDYLGNLCLFSHVLVVTICDHGGIYPGWTMGQPPNRRCKQCEVLFASDVILHPKKASTGHVTLVMAASGVWVPQKSLS